MGNWWPSNFGKRQNRHFHNIHTDTESTYSKFCSCYRHLSEIHNSNWLFFLDSNWLSKSILKLKKKILWKWLTGLPIFVVEGLIFFKTWIYPRYIASNWTLTTYWSKTSEWSRIYIPNNMTNAPNAVWFYINILIDQEFISNWNI